MVSSLLLALREGLEAALVVGIILVYLSQSGRKDLNRFVYFGALTGLVLSLIGGFIGFVGARQLSEEGEELFEGIAMLLASGLIAYFIAWMGSQANNISAGIKEKAGRNTSAIGLFVLSFLSVFREGLELSIFTLTKISENASDIAFGTGIGLIFAVLLTYVIFRTSIKLNLKLIFKILGIVLIYLGATMFAEGIMKLFGFDIQLYKILLMIIFIIPSLYFFLKNDIRKLKK